jgi:hypothetical protein
MGREADTRSKLVFFAFVIAGLEQYFQRGEGY